MRNLTYITFSLFIFLCSCNDENSALETQRNVSFEELEGAVKLADSNMPIKKFSLFDQREEYAFSEYTISYLNSDFFNHLINSLNIDVSHEISSIVLFYASEYENIKKIQFSEILGAQIIWIENKQLYTTYFESDSGKFIENSYFKNLKTVGENSRDKLFIFDKVLYPNLTKKVACITLKNLDLENSNLSDLKDDFLAKEALYFGEKVNAAIKNRVIALNRESELRISQEPISYILAGGSCGPGCPEGGGYCEGGSSSSPGGRCSSGGGGGSGIGCTSLSAEAVLLDGSQISTSTIIETFQKDLQYDVRDNFLTGRVYGEKVKRYYNAISYSERSDISLDLALQVYELMPEMVEVLEKLNTVQSNNNEILIDNQLNSGLKDLIIEFRNLSQDREYQDILTDIESDIEMLTNKTLQEVENIVSL